MASLCAVPGRRPAPAPRRPARPRPIPGRGRARRAARRRRRRDQRASGLVRESTGPRSREVLAGTPLKAYTTAAHRCFGTDLRPLLPEVRCPVLLLVGEHDTRTPRSHAERIAAGLAHADIQEIPGAGHLANVDAPRRFTTALQAFWSAMSG
ncbi:alpha/beta fold hydrolase [Actinoallomurus liliacearum]|uniref:alpha/beta fold hydrolase n=1 Tax=Actinoallomurus liliacearum TaxID=1080073 RepID=UPI003CD07466